MSAAITGSLSRCANADEQRHAYDGMAREANRQMWLRRERYPALVDAGKLDEAEANAEIEAWAEITRDWDWIATGKGQPATKATLPARIAALDTALDRVIGQIEFRDTREMRERGAMIAAMRWWADVEANDEPTRHARFLASVGHQWREANGHPPLGDMIHARTPVDDALPAQAQASAPTHNPETEQRQLFA